MFQLREWRILRMSLSEIQEDILNILKQNGALTRLEICKALGFEIIGFTESPYGIYPQYKYRTTIYENLCRNKKNLMKQGLIESFKKKHGIHNRTYWKLVEV